MASIINASTSGAGGVITTADASGVLNIQTAGTTAISVNASQAVTLTNALPIGSGGTGVTTGPFAMTLLGTITTTAVNSVSLGSLTLTGYKSLFISFGLTSSNQATCWVTSNNTQSGGGIVILTSGGGGTYGTMWLDLSNGYIGGGGSPSSYLTASSYAAGGITNVTTSTTTIYFRLNTTNTFGASQSIVIYGVK